ncbi:DUF302 domain-containing protein [Halomicrobium salinisoli]|uniref:DUF302 domain-containing protein n=1 Tax=Halomicrobium salinisoli TaxID=2878391 RepID=UPI001CF08D88|nr:DUF302 domain-containing protein [Halomicrobium salinisoli]
MEYTTQQQVDGEFDDVVQRTIDALGDEGFGVLCDIDVQATFEEKLDEEFRRYRILGACNPPLALEGLEAELELGALLPCNVVVYETDEGDVVVSAVDPEGLVGLTGNDELDSIAEEVGDRFERVLGSL